MHNFIKWLFIYLYKVTYHIQNAYILYSVILYVGFIEYVPFDNNLTVFKKPRLTSTKLI